MIKGIIFDYDGTIIDTNDLIIKCIKESALKISNKHITKSLLDRILGRTLDEQMKIIDEEKYEELMEYYKEIYDKYNTHMTYLYNGIKELIEELKRNDYKTFILSNKGRKGIEFGLKKFNLEDQFDEIISMDDVNKGKPDLEGINKIIQNSNLNKDELIFIGDSPYDIEVGKKAKIETVLVDWTIFDKKYFDYKYDYLINEPDDLIKILNKFKD